MARLSARSGAAAAADPAVGPLHVGEGAPPFRLQPVFGLPVATGATPLVVLFFGGLQGDTARVVIPAVHALLPRLDAAGVRVVGFTRSTLDSARDFVPRHHVLFPIVTDPEGATFARWGVAEDRSRLAVLRALRPSALRATLTGAPDPAARQLPAAFVVGGDGRLRHAWYARQAGDPVDLEAVCAAAVP